MFIHIIMSLLAIALGSNEMPSQSFSSTQVTILQADGTSFAPEASLNYRFSFALQSPPTGIRRVFVAVAGYSITSNVSFDFFTNLIYYSTTNVVLQFNAFGDLQVYSMTFCVMATTAAAYPYMAVDEYLITPQNLSNPNLTQNILYTNQYLTLSSSLFFTHTNFIFIPYFSFVKSTNSNGPTGVDLFLGSINAGSSNFVLRLKVRVGGVISLIKVAIILVNLNIVNSMNKLYFISNLALVNHNYPGIAQSSLASQVGPSYFPTRYGPNFSRNCTLAIIFNFQLNNALPKKVMFDYSTSAGFTNISQGGDGLNVNIVGLCTADCISSGFYNMSSSQCQRCDTYIPYCTSCINSTYCLNCGINAYFNSLRSQCLCNGFWVKGGCTSIFYCQEVDSLTGRCKKCGQNYTLSFTGMRCDCLTGNLGMSGICTSITGCITAALVHGKVQCLSCNITNNFRLSLNSTCNCKGGLTLKNEVCVPLCGDGMLYLDEACDDGNNNDGDGCSSTCTIEKYYVCKNGSATHKSDCYYSNPNIKLSLTRTYKDTKDNIGIFVFTFTPAPSNLNNINFTASTNFTTKPKHQISNILFSGSQLTLYIFFEEDLQNEYASLQLNLDQNIILKNKYFFNFQMKSSNYPLIVFKHQDELLTLKLTAHILVGATLLLFILGSWSHRMIGIQTINVFLLIFFTLSNESFGSLQIFSPIIQLRYLSNYGDLFQQEQGTNRNIVNMLHLRSSFIESNFIIQSLYLLALFSLAGTALHHQFKQNSKFKNVNIRKSCYDSFPFSFIFYVFILPLSLGYFSQTFITAILSIVSMHAHSFPSDNIFLLIGFGSTAFIISLQCAHLTYSNTSRKETVYFFLYTTNIVIFVAFLVLSWCQSAFLYLLMLESIIYFLFLVIFRPYTQCLHSFGVTINQFTIVLWVGVLIANKTTTFNEDIQYLFISGVIILLICVDATAALRIIYQLYSFGSQKKVMQQSLLISESKMKKKSRDEIDDQKITSFHNNFKQSFLRQKRRIQVNDGANNVSGQLMPHSQFINGQVSPLNRGKNNQEILMQMRARLRNTLIKSLEDGINEEE